MGEISPLLFSHTNTELFRQGAKRLRNVLALPQGGVERRFGTDFVDDFTSTESNYKNVKPFIFNHQDGSVYLFVFSAADFTIYKDGTKIAKSLSGDTPPPWTASEVSELNFAQSNDILFVFHGTKKPHIITRDSSSDTDWTITDMSANFDPYPGFDFAQDYFGSEFSVSKLSDGLNGNSFGTAENKIGAELFIDVNSGSFTFGTRHEGGLIFGWGAVLRMTSRSSNSRMRCRILERFDPDSEIGTTSTFLNGDDMIITEPAFSDARGWPKNGIIFQNRLFLANTDTLPGGLWGSNFNGFGTSKWVFDDSNTLATSAVSTVLFGEKQVTIQHLKAYRTLLAFTTDGIYSTSLLQDQPITPENAAFLNIQTNDAILDIEPKIFEDRVLVFDRGGRKVKMLQVDPDNQQLKTQNISILAEQLIDTPFSATVLKQGSETSGEYLLMVNDGSNLGGDLAVFQNVPEMEINAWTLSTTQGDFRHVIASEDVVYFIVGRNINSSDVLYIEQLNFSRDTDSASFQTGLGSATTITGLSHLEDETVKVIGDGAILADKTVSSGSIELEVEVDEVEVGLGFAAEVVPLPTFIPTQQSRNVFRPKTVKTLYVDFVDSLGITVNGTIIPELELGSYTLGVSPPTQTGIGEVTPMGGWDSRTEISISQDDPLPFKIIGLGFEIEA